MSSETQIMINLTIDGTAISVPKGTTVYQAAKKHGIAIPVFCYQDRMPPFGACRMCLVEVEKMGKLQTSCTLECTEGMVVKTQKTSTIATNGQKEILEFLLINHPLDCPICDRGGECPLQDNTLDHGPGNSRFVEEKRHFKKPLPLGPVLMLDRERCITCARCTRFGDIVAGDHALEFIDRGFKTEVGTPDGGPAESKFIGNTIMICPVGALTSQVYRFRARPWDNEPTETTCTLCPVGCSMYLDSRDGEIMRTRSRENSDVNDIWLCDKGWFGYEFSHHPARLQTPLIRQNGKLESTSWETAFALVAKKIREVKPEGKLAAFGGNPLTIEENYLFQRLMREGAGVHNVDHRIGMNFESLEEEGISAGMEMSIGEIEGLSFAVLFGIDLTEEFPLIWLRLKKAINQGAKVIFMGHFAPEMTSKLTETILHRPGKEMEMLSKHLPEIAKLTEAGQKGAFFVGRQYLANSHRKAILSKLMKIKNVKLNILEGRGNSAGARLAGMRPDVGPFGNTIQHSGLNAMQVVEKAAKSGWDFLYVAGANPATKFPSQLWKEARDKLGFMVVQDLFMTETARQADLVLPTLGFVEKQGTFMNIEGRLHKLLPGKDVPAGIFSDADIFRQIALELNVPVAYDEHFMKMMRESKLPQFRPTIESVEAKEQSSPQNGNLLATFTPALFDHGSRMKHNTRLVQMSKEPKVRIHPDEGAKRGINDGDKVRFSSKQGSIVGKISLDKQVAEGTAVFPMGYEELPVHEFGANLMNGLEIEIGRL